MPETEAQRRAREMRSADRAAGTMFNLFPQGVGERVSRGAQSLAGMAMGAMNRLSNPLGALASDIGATRQAVSGTRLIGRREPFQDQPTPMTTVLPSGTPMVGFDSYPTLPQSIPKTASATAPQPAAPSLSPVPAFPATGLGIMGNQNISPLPIDQISPMTRMAPTLADRGNVSVDIGGMQGKTPIQTPYGTVYATAQQAGTGRVAEMGGLPAQSARLANIGEQAQRSAAIAQMRERGTALAQQRLGAQEAFFAQRRAERGALAEAESAARASGVRPMDIMRARETVAGPSSIAAIQRQSTIGPMSPVGTTVARFAGALPPESERSPMASMSPYSNVRSERRRRTRQLAAGRGMQPAYSLPIQEAQEDYFRRQGMM